MYHPQHHASSSLTVRWALIYVYKAREEKHSKGGGGVKEAWWLRREARRRHNATNRQRRTSKYSRILNLQPRFSVSHEPAIVPGIGLVHLISYTIVYGRQISHRHRSVLDLLWTVPGHQEPLEQWLSGDFANVSGRPDAKKERSVSVAGFACLNVPQSMSHVHSLPSHPRELNVGLAGLVNWESDSGICGDERTTCGLASARGQLNSRDCKK